MGVIGFCAKSIGVLVLLVALLLGWLSQQEHPIGIFFATIYKVKGIGKPGTEAVPADLLPAKRPEGEIFLTLPGGDKMPANGLGMCCRPTAYDPVSVRRTITWYLLQGGRHIDTASLYLNHEAVGLGMKDAIERGVPRKEIFLTTKIFPDHYGYESGLKRGREMLKELGVDYIDLVLMHLPIKLSPKLIFKYYTTSGLKAKMSSDAEITQLRKDTWKALSKLKDDGLIRNVGVSNFGVELLKEIQALNLAPIAAHQMQYHPWVPDWVQDTVKFCHQNNIAITGYWSLGGNRHKDKTFDLAPLNEVANKHKRRPAQILLRWNLQKNISVIPGTGNPHHMVDNLGSYDFALSDEDMRKLDSMKSLEVSKEFMVLEF